MASKKLGETKGPTIVWLFVTFYFAIGIAFSESSNGTLPQSITPSLIVSLLLAMATGWGVVLVFLVIFLAFWEGQRSLKGIFSSVGLKRKGSVKGVFWSFAMFPLFIIIGLMAMMISNFLGPLPTVVSNNVLTQPIT